MAQLVTSDAQLIWTCFSFLKNLFFFGFLEIRLVLFILMTPRTQIVTLNYCHAHQIKSRLIHAAPKFNFHKLPFCCRLWLLSRFGFSFDIKFWFHVFDFRLHSIVQKQKQNIFFRSWDTSFLQLVTSVFLQALTQCLVQVPLRVSVSGQTLAVHCLFF